MKIPPFKTRRLEYQLQCEALIDAPNMIPRDPEGFDSSHEMPELRSEKRAARAVEWVLDGFVGPRDWM